MTNEHQTGAGPEDKGLGANPIPGPRPLGGLADLAQLLAGDSPRSRKFLGGLTIGALVGAALAGGSLLRRRGRDRGRDRGE